MHRLYRLAILVVLLAPLLAFGGDTPDDEAAQRHFNRGRELYNGGHYAEAIAEFAAARELHASPAFDFNIARCLDRLERWREAADAYDLYLRQARAPDSERRELEQRIAVLRERARRAPPRPPLESLPSPPATTAAVTTPPPPAAAPRKRPWVWGVVGGSIGLVVVGVGVAVGVVLGTRRHEPSRIMDVTF